MGALENEIYPERKRGRLFLLRRRRAGKEGPDTSQPVLAQLEFMGDQGVRHDIVQPILRIGRNAANDLHIANDSVSGFHAELHRDREGRFNITDLNSTNGLLVNERKCRSQILVAGDIIELGDVRFRFHEAEERDV